MMGIGTFSPRLLTAGCGVALWFSTCAFGQGKAPQTALSDATQISAAVAAARDGKPEVLMRLTLMASQDLTWKPEKEALPLYYRQLETDENPFVQYFAVVAVGRLKDHASLKPLQEFIIDAQRRCETGDLGKPEFAALQLALQTAIAIVAEIDGDNDLSVAFLSTLLKHDIQTDFGGAVAHSALARKGRPGLRRLLEASLTAADNELGYIRSAISGIRDPTLVGDLYAVCLDTRYPPGVRTAALGAIASMRTVAPQAEQLVIDILLDERSDLRGFAAASVGRFGTDKGREILRDLRSKSGRINERLSKDIDDALLQYDAENSIDGAARTILSDATPDAEKIRICESLVTLEKAVVTGHSVTLSSCLQVRNAKGEPLNRARVSVWLALYRATGVKHPLELVYKNDQRFALETSAITSEIQYKLEDERKYPYGVPKRMAEDETRSIVIRWTKGRTGEDR